jgi:phosphoserine phosphatase
MRIYVVRHGETQWNKEEVFRGRKDIPLNETGERQAAQVGAYFAGVPVNCIASSPLQRAVQTAQAICARTGMHLDMMDEFTDINFGVWEGLRLREVEERCPVDFDTWKTSPERFQVEGGESLDTVRRRVLQGLEKTAIGEATVVVVTHRVICKMIVLAGLNIGNDHFWDMKYDPASITLLEGRSGGFVLSFSNQTCHLERSLSSTIYRDF